MAKQPRRKTSCLMPGGKGERKKKSSRIAAIATLTGAPRARRLRRDGTPGTAKNNRPTHSPTAQSAAFLLLPGPPSGAPLSDARRRLESARRDDPRARRGPRAQQHTRTSHRNRARLAPPRRPKRDENNAGPTAHESGTRQAGLRDDGVSARAQTRSDDPTLGTARRFLRGLDAVR